MSELRRWSEEGATAGELSFLDASRSERAPTDARARALKALGISAVVTSTVTVTTTASATTATTAGLTLLAKIAGISLLGGGIVAGGLMIRGLHFAPSGPTAVPSSVVVAPSERAQTSEPPAREPPPATSLPAASVPAAPATGRASARPARAAPADDRLSQEVVALERAHRALASRDPDAALRMLDRYGAQFPGGALSSEATVLRVQALLARGDRAGAQTLADSYSAAHRDSPYARRIEDLVRDGQKE